MFYSVIKFLKQRSIRRNIGILLRFVAMLLSIILIYGSIFHYIMELEHRSFSWITGLYWTMTVMSTLGFGDITFTSDLGRGFSILVLASGILFIMLMLPFMFTKFFYAPWLEAQKKGQAPRTVSNETQGHIIVVNPSPIALNLVEDLKNYGTKYVLLCKDSRTTLDLLDRGYNAVVGEHDSEETYRNLRLSNAAMLVALNNDESNTSIVFTARNVNHNVSIVASVQKEEAVDILQLAGSTHVFLFHKLLGEALARRVLNDKARCSIISRFEELVIAEAPVMRTSLVGKSLIESGLRNATGVTVVGLWERGKFILPSASTVFTSTMVMVIAGNMEQIEAVNQLLGLQENKRTADESHVVILGGGRVGLAAARQLQAGDRQYRIVDKTVKKIIPQENMVVGDASDLAVLDKANLRTASAVIITTHDDDTNIYLTLYCRRLCERTQIISRANLDRNVSILHSAGADLVLSLASMVTNHIINLLSPGKVLMINEGLNIFRSPVGKVLADKPLKGSGIRSQTHCSVVALRTVTGIMLINPEPNHIFAYGEELFMMGDSKAEKIFFEKFAI